MARRALCLAEHTSRRWPAQGRLLEQALVMVVAAFPEAAVLELVLELGLVVAAQGWA